MGRLARIIIEYLIAFLLIISLLMAIAGVIVVKFYGEDLQSYVIREVNERLDSKVYVEEADVKVFHKFPNTSIVLKNVTVWSSHNFNTREFDNVGADTLLTAGRVSVSFNLFGLIRKRYNIRQLEIMDGSLHLLTDRSGEGNYSVVAGEKNGGKGERQINMSQLKVSNYSIYLDNRAKLLKSSGLLQQLNLNGKFSRRNTQIKGDLKGYVDEISNKGILYASDREIRAKLNMDVKDSLYSIRAGQLQIDRIIADIDGTFRSDPDSGVYLDLFAAARNLNIHEILDLLPSELSSPLQEIRGNGILQLYARVTGLANSTLTPRIEADFQTSNANLSWDRLPFSLKNLNLTGTYSNGGDFNPITTSLNIENISAVIGDDHISGNGTINNFYDPDFSVDLKGDIHPEQWVNWYSSLPLDKADGTVYSDLILKGSYERLNPPGERFISFDLTGGVSLEDVMFQIGKESTPFTDLNGTILIENDFWEPSLKGMFGTSDFSVSGSGLNLLSFIIDKEDPLVASATFRSNRFDLREVLDNLPGTKEGKRTRSGKRSGSEKKTGIHFPDRLKLNLDFVINDFSMDRLKASNVRGIAQYDSPLFHVDSLSMQTMDGSLTGRFAMVQDLDNDIVTNVSASLYNLDITQLFFAFNSFGQTQLTHEHLSGSVSGTSVFSANFDSTFTIQTESILSENDVIIHDGELIEFSPIMALSRFIEVEELTNIRFETLENTVLIRENQVIIPVMDIQSNALNLSASGSHGFDSRYDYRVRLLLSDLLYNKARRSENAEFEIAADESDTRTLFLKIYDKGSGSEVEVDRERTAEKIRNDLKEEKAELKSILNKELGLFRSDADVNNQNEEEKDSEEIFKFEFSDDPDSTSLKTPEREKGRFWRRRLKNDTVENKPVRRFVIDENP